MEDWSRAQELDVAAAVYVQQELRKLEYERERRDREFWIRSFGGNVDSQAIAELPDGKAESADESDPIARSALSRQGQWQAPLN